MDNFKKNMEFLSRDETAESSAYPQDGFPSERELDDFGFIQIEPNKWKIAIENRVNKAFFALITILNAVILILIMLLQIKAYAGVLSTAILLAFSLSSILYALLRKTNSYYILDRQNGEIIYCLKSICFKWTSRITEFREVAYATATGYDCKGDFDNTFTSVYKEIELAKKVNFRSGSIWRESMGVYTPFKSPDRTLDREWRYAPILVLKDGSSIQIADFTSKSHTLTNHTAKILAKIIECEHFPAPQESILSVEISQISGSPEITHKSNEKLDEEE